MLLNKIPVLDQGYVALISSAMSHKVYSDTVDEFFGAVDNVSLHRLSFATLVFKAPLFVQMHLGQHGVKIVHARPANQSSDSLGAYLPNHGEIAGPDLESNRAIADDIERTTAALLINPASYRADGADRFISQIILPISTYTTFLVGATLEDWQKFYRMKSVPTPIRSYADAVEQIIKAEWKNV